MTTAPPTLAEIIKGLESYLGSRYKREKLAPGTARVTPTQYLQVTLVLLQELLAAQAEQETRQ